MAQTRSSIWIPTCPPSALPPYPFCTHTPARLTFGHAHLTMACTSTYLSHLHATLIHWASCFLSSSRCFLPRAHQAWASCWLPYQSPPCSLSLLLDLPHPSSLSLLPPCLPPLCLPLPLPLAPSPCLRAAIACENICVDLCLGGRDSRWRFDCGSYAALHHLPAILPQPCTSFTAPHHTPTLLLPPSPPTPRPLQHAPYTTCAARRERFTP